MDLIVKDFLVKIAGVRSRIVRVVLFGSRARGTHRHDSDYDMLLVVDRKDDDLLDVLYEAVMDVLLQHGRLISLKVFPEGEFARLRALRTPFMQHIEHEGIVVG